MTSYHIKIISSLKLIALPLALNAQLIFNDVSNDTGFMASVPGDAHGSGVAAADYDNDGDIDLYICSEREHSDFLYLNTNGNFESIGAGIGLNSTTRSRMALWIDIDGDSDLDLLVSGDCDFDENDCPDASHMKLYLQSNGMFEEISEQAGLASFGPKRKDQTLGGLAAADVNNDGFIDFVQAIRNGPLELFINNQDGTFTEDAEDYGFDKQEFKYYQPIFNDFNGDGNIDLYCNVDFDKNQLWINSHSQGFTETGRNTRSDNSFNEMGITLGDFDNDGDFDIYSTNIANFLGQDVHNILLRNDTDEDGTIVFREVSKQENVDQGGWGWGATFFDANNDGWLDLATTNGWDVPFEVIDNSKMWIRQSGGTFEDLSDSVAFNDDLNSASLISIDYDRDGDLDMIQSIKGFIDPKIPVRLLRNDISTEHKGNYLVVKPRMNGNNFYAIGAVIRAKVDDNTIYSRLIHAGTSFYGQEPAEAFFGIGSSNIVEQVEIIWPGGAVSTWSDVAANQIIELTDEDVVHTPGRFSAQVIETNIKLTWIDNASNEDGFIIQRSEDVEFSNFDEIEVSPNSKEYTDDDLELNTTYYYRIYAFNENTTSLFSEQIEASVIILSSELEDQLQEPRFYPNPIKQGINEFHLDFNKEINQLKLINSLGQRTSNINLARVGSDQYVLTFSDLPAGIYFLKINEFTQKIVFE